jgi:hypothetical protein
VRDGDLDRARGGERERRRGLDGRSGGSGDLAGIGGWAGDGAAPARTKPVRKEEPAGLEGKEAGSDEEEKPRPCLKRRAPSPLRLSSS